MPTVSDTITVPEATRKLLASAERNRAAEPLSAEKISRYRLSVHCVGHQCSGRASRSVCPTSDEYTSQAKGARITADANSAARWMKILYLRLAVTVTSSRSAGAG